MNIAREDFEREWMALESYTHTHAKGYSAFITFHNRAQRALLRLNWLRLWNVPIEDASLKQRLLKQWFYIGTPLNYHGTQEEFGYEPSIFLGMMHWYNCKAAERFANEFDLEYGKW